MKSGKAAGEARLEALLSEANLLRMRGQWIEAEARCVDVMRSDPDNVHAHMLLGDLNRDQSKWEEAAQWYRMASDLQPHSAAHKARLREAEQHLARRERTAPSLARPAPPVLVNPKGAGGSGDIGTKNLAGLSPTAWLRAIWLLCGLFVVAVVILIVWIRSRPPGNSMPNGTIRTTVGELGSRVDPNAPPQIPSGTLRLGPQGSAGQGSTGANSPPTPGTSKPQPGSLGDRETALLLAISRQGGLSGSATVGSATIDPREQKATIILSERISTAADVPPNMESLRTLVLADAIRAATTAFGADAQIERVTVNSRLWDGTNTAPFFAGDIDRASARRAADAVTAANVLSLFNNVWWSEPAAGSNGIGVPPGGAGEGG